ncbi:MAG TPA: hypothetical protein VG711_07965 [Phycisphaerales bacterium]|nr:hypothetical protein [Phycisphaerales bacterium]
MLTHVRSLFVALAAFVMVSSRAFAALPAQSQPQINPDDPMQVQVRSNLIKQPLGDQTLAVLDLPDQFLSRVADRIIRESFEQNFRIIVDTQPAIQPASAPGAPASLPSAATAPAPASPKKISPLFWTLPIPPGLVIVLMIVIRRNRRKASL